MFVTLKSPRNGLLKRVKIGFSWTTFFFGIFVPLTRGDFKWAIIMFLLASFTFGLSSFVFPFIYNKLFIKELIEEGYTPKDSSDELKLNNIGIIFASDY